MNGVHDMGGMQGFGPIRPEPNEPVFHAEWEGRVFALSRALAARGPANLDAARSGVEMLPPTDYLSMSYYERWFVRMAGTLVNSGSLTQAELDSGRVAAGGQRGMPLTTDQLSAFMSGGTPKRRNVVVAARFRVGQRVRARNMNPATHTRLPRYARGKTGVVDRDYGIFVFPDTNALFQGEKPQHVYSVRFAARELWGDQAKAKDSVYIDLWDDYLERA